LRPTSRRAAADLQGSASLPCRDFVYNLQTNFYEILTKRLTNPIFYGKIILPMMGSFPIRVKFDNIQPLQRLPYFQISSCRGFLFHFLGCFQIGVCRGRAKGNFWKSSPWNPSKPFGKRF
jgi:hypothetical protein